jgi:protein-L-isoaspartate O-methyltransferase
MRPPNDPYVTGMVDWSESELALTPSLGRWQYALLRPHLGRKLLEVGAGGGRITALVAAAGCHDEIVAVEPSAFLPLAPDRRRQIAEDHTDGDAII